jgi:hypothetical protein
VLLRITHANIEGVADSAPIRGLTFLIRTCISAH